jgi:hypothetical protein
VAITTLHWQCKHEDAEKFYRLHLEQEKATVGDDDPNTIRAMCNLAHHVLLSQTTGKRGEAEELYKLRLVETRRTSLRDTHPSILQQLMKQPR